MGWNDHMDDDDVHNFPPEAWDNAFDQDGPFEPNNFWLERAEPEEKRIAMRAWFLSRYCDPAHSTPYDGREGGYLFADGGPYDPADELSSRFSNIIDDDLIQEIAEEMHEKVGDEWALIDRSPYEDEYDERFSLTLIAQTDPLRKLQDRLQQSKSVLLLQGDAEAESLAEKLVYGAAISALEAFLWETVAYWIENDEKALRNFITKIPVFRDEPIKLGDVFARYDNLKTHVKAYLQNLVWHRWEKVVPLFELGLGIKMPSVRGFNEAIIKRHDIVHRSGHNKDGIPIIITTKEIQDLCRSIESFAIDLSALLEEG